MAVLNVPLQHLLPGMFVAEDVYNKSQQKILSKNTIVSQKTVIKLSIYGVKEIIVYIPQSLADKIEDDVETPTNMLKETLEYKKFKKYYLEIIEDLKTLFSSLLHQQLTILPIFQLLPKIETLYKDCGNSMRTFDMLHCMREYDDLIYVHSLNVALMCYSFGTWLNYSQDDVRKITLAGLLHDIGKLKIPPDIISKPSKLNTVEYTIVKQHPKLGYELIKDIELDEHIKLAILMHHERCDGSGYPHGLVNSQINNIAKIISITDVYDAMTSNRVYRDPICPFDVLERIEHDGFDKYDPTYLIPFLQQAAQSYIGTSVILNNSLIGEVIMINNSNLTKPIVKVDEKFYDLSKMSYLKIKEFL